MPSDHFATAAMAAMVLGEVDPVAGAIGWAYAVALGFALVYLGELADQMNALRDNTRPLSDQLSELRTGIEQLERELGQLREVAEPLRGATERMGRLSERLPGRG